MSVCGAIAKMLGCVSFLLSFSEDSVRVPLYLVLIDCSGDLLLFLSETDRSGLVSFCLVLIDCSGSILNYFWVLPGLAMVVQEEPPRSGIGWQMMGGVPALSWRGLLSHNDTGARKRENYSTCGGLDTDLFVQYDLIVRTKKL